MSNKQITLDYQEYLDMQSELDSLRKPAEGAELTEAEHQEATGILLTRALNNPDVFRHIVGPINLGKYKAIFASIKSINITNSMIGIKFERT